MLTATELLQHLRVDVAAADNGDVQLRSRKLIAVEQERGHGRGSAGFSQSVGICRQQTDCFNNFFFAYGDDVVNAAADVLEVDWSDALRAQSVGDGEGDLCSAGN